jgi:hypothetical protein
MTLGTSIEPGLAPGFAFEVTALCTCGRACAAVFTHGLRRQTTYDANAYQHRPTHDLATASPHSHLPAGPVRAGMAGTVHGVAAAAPLIQSQGFELICTSTGAVKLIVKGEDGSSVLGAGHLDCPMCLPHAAPPPPALQLPPPTESPLWHALQPVQRARIASLTAAPCPRAGRPRLPLNHFGL